MNRRLKAKIAAAREQARYLDARRPTGGRKRWRRHAKAKAAPTSDPNSNASQR